VFETCWAVLTALTPVSAEERGQLRPLTRWLMERGEAVGAPEFGRAVGELRRVAARALIALAPYDIVLTPTLAAAAAAVGAIRDDADPARDFENQKRFTPYTSTWNITGMPAVSLPLHVTPDGLPVGVMLAGVRRGRRSVRPRGPGRGGRPLGRPAPAVLVIRRRGLAGRGGAR
jgi:amidase